MIWLATDTSSAAGSLAIFRDQHLLGERTWSRQGSHSEFITVSYEGLLAELNLTHEDVERLAVGIGPGSFTGIRVAINFTRTFGYLQKIPAFALNSLHLTALGAIEHVKNGSSISVAQYGFRDLLYVAEYQVNKMSLNETMSPKVISLKNWLTSLKPNTLVIGTAINLLTSTKNSNHLENICRNLLVPDTPQARNFSHTKVHLIERSELSDWNQVVPLYIRASEAEEKLRGGSAEPI